MRVAIHGSDAVDRVIRSNFGEMKNYVRCPISQVAECSAVVVEGCPSEDIYPQILQCKGPRIALNWKDPFSNKVLAFDHVYTPDISRVRQLQSMIGSHNAHYMPDLSLFKEMKSLSGVLIIADYPGAVNNSISDALFKLSSNLGERQAVFLCGKDVAMIQQRVRAANKKSSGPSVLQNYSAAFDFTVCFSYESLIHALISQKPFLFIATDKTTSKMAKQMGLEPYTYDCSVEDGVCKLSYNNLKVAVRRAIISDFTLVKNFFSKINYHLKHMQVGNLLNSVLLAKDKSPQTIFNEVKEYLLSRKDIGDTEADVVGRLVTYRITGCNDSEYVYGARANFKDTPHKLLEQITWLISDIANKVQPEIIKPVPKDPWNMDIRDYTQYKDLHRSGWFPVVEKLYSTCSSNGLIFDMFLDKTFHWCYNINQHLGRIPYTSPWIGFVHHHYDNKTEYSDYNTCILFQKEAFIQSLSACGAIFTLSDTLTRKIRERLDELKFPDIPVVTFIHPTVLDVPLFNIEKCLENKGMVQVGAWLRRSFSIWEVECKWNKFALQGRKMENYFPPANVRIKHLSEYKEDISEGDTKENKKDPETLSRGCANNIWMKGLGEFLNGKYYIGNTVYVADVKNAENEVKRIYPTVKIIPTLSDGKYDELLSNNIVFVDFSEDIAACNTIIECIVRRTPMVINRKKGVVEMLGDSYPLFFDRLTEVPALLTENNIRLAHEYLINLSKDIFSLEKFVTNVRNVISALNIA